MLATSSSASLPALGRHGSAAAAAVAAAASPSGPPSAGGSASTLAHTPTTFTRQRASLCSLTSSTLAAAAAVAAATADGQIKLTGYCALPPESSATRTLSLANTTERNEQPATHRLWTTVANRQHRSAAAAAPPDEKCQTPTGPGVGHESFQIVWTRLAFEVRLGAYDKLLNKTYSCLRTVCSGLGGGGGGGGGGNTAASTLLDGKQLEAGGISRAQEKPPGAGGGGGGGGGENCGGRIIFENLNGFVNSGELTAILGPSGSGKTSLLNAICGRTDNYRGQMRLVGAGKRRRMRLSIIPQKDYLIENLTVRENLLYSSKILNPESNFDHELAVARVVQMLNLSACYHSSAANISGGEYKRVSIAQELLRQPDILVLDEPTSGLDSLTCKKLVRSLVQLIEASRAGRQLRPIAIVMTIHQPDVEVFHMFDHVYCMARGGRVIFDGRPRDALAHVRTHASISPAVKPPATSETCNACGPCNTCNMCNHNNNNNNNSASESNTIDLGGSEKGGAADTPGDPVAVNPANLLIEIASEDLYGQEPIERLARVQRKRFEQMLDPSTGGVSPAGSPQRGRRHLSANLSAISAWPRSGHLKSSHAPGNKLARAISSSAATLSSVNSSSRGDGGATTPPSPGGSSEVSVHESAAGRLVRDKRLSVKNDHSGRFCYYTRVLAARAFKSTLRDPLMTLITMLFHLCIPFVMWTVYPRRIGTTHGCPVIQHELDIVSMASNRTADRLEELHEQVIGTLECSTMFFLTTYSFSMCSLTVSALAFPLNMHVLLKEVRNGWYNLPAYVLAKTLANFPFEVLFPVVSLVMIYALLDMPSSAYEWRMWSMALVMALVSMISHTQGLIFGALCMDSVQTAIFMASASTLPQALLSGFTARIRFMPLLLQRLSWLSQYRYSSDLINMLRFGFGICPCAPSTDEYLRTRAPEFKDMPGNLKPVFIYYLMSNAPGAPGDPDSLQAPTLADNSTLANSTATTTTAATTTTTTTTTGGPLQFNNSGLATGAPATDDHWLTTSSGGDSAAGRLIPGVDRGVMLSADERYALLKRMDAGEVDLFGNMAEMISRAFSFGRKLEGCPSVRSQLLATGGTPPDSKLPLMFAGMLGLLLAYKLILFLTVRQKIGSRL